MKKKIEKIRSIHKTVQATKTIAGIKFAEYEKSLTMIELAQITLYQILMKLIFHEQNIHNIRANFLSFAADKINKKNIPYTYLTPIVHHAPLLLVFGGHQTLCGCYNHVINNSIDRQIMQLHQQYRMPVNVLLFGNKTKITCATKTFNLLKRYDYPNHLAFSNIQELFDELFNFIINGKLSSDIYILNGHKNTIFNKTVQTSLFWPFNVDLPQKVSDTTKIAIKTEPHPNTRKETNDFNIFKTTTLSIYLPNMVIEPDLPTGINVTMEEYLYWLLYSRITSTFVGINLARATIMHNAERNAKNMIDTLTIDSNKLRQTTITNNINEIVNASMAMD